MKLALDEFLNPLKCSLRGFPAFAEDDGVVGVSACSHVLLTEFYIQFAKNYVRTHGRYNTPLWTAESIRFPNFPFLANRRSEGIYGLERLHVRPLSFWIGVELGKSWLTVSKELYVGRYRLPIRIPLEYAP